MTDTANAALARIIALLDADNVNDDCPVAIDLVDIMAGGTADDALGAESIHYLELVELVGQLDMGDDGVIALYIDLGMCPAHGCDLETCDENGDDCNN